VFSGSGTWSGNACLNNVFYNNGSNYTYTPTSGVIINDAGGIASAFATPAGGSSEARLVLGTTSGFGVYIGSGAPSVSAAQGSLYLRSDGSSTSSRAYINNSSGSGTTWTALTTAA
jgi:hypothetical protein